MGVCDVHSGLPPGIDPGKKCGSGTGRTAEPDTQTVISRNKIETIPFFYLRGGCFPLKDVKGMYKIMLTMFVKMLKKRKDKDEKIEEAVSIIENGLFR